jgi:putative ABC transport system permease protein
MPSLFHDIRFAIRVLLKSPGFALIAVLTLALGIGTNTAIFSVVNAVLLRPLPFRDPSRLVLVIEKSKYPTITVSYENYLDWRDQSHSFESMEAIYGTNMTLTGKGDPQRLVARRITAGFLPAVGVSPRIGRNFSADEDRAGGTPVALLSYGLWQNTFGGSNSILGQSVTLDSQPYTVIGVLPPGFKFFQEADVFLPFHPWAKTLPDDRNWHPGILPGDVITRSASRRAG